MPLNLIGVVRRWEAPATVPDCKHYRAACRNYRAAVVDVQI